MIDVRIRCPWCDGSLMDEAKPLDGHPSIVVVGQTDGQKGKIWLSSLYGSFNIESEIEAPEGAVTEFSCPLCEERLQSSRSCEVCSASMVAFRFAEGGIVQICSRRGCKRHLVEFTDIRAELRAFVDTHARYF